MASPTVTLYSSTDSGAPVLSGTPGSLISVLNACLVSGYGSKSGAGWSLLGQGTSTSNPNTAMFKMGSGTECVLYIRDNNNMMYGCYNAYATGGQPTSTFAGGLVGNFPNSSVLASNNTGYVYIPKSTQVAAATSVPWWIIASSNMLYLVSSPGICAGSTYGTSQTQFCHVFAFGDLYGLKAGDSGGCLIMGEDAFPSLGGNQAWPRFQNSGVAVAKIGSACVDPYGSHFLATTGNGLTPSPLAGKIMDQSLYIGTTDCNIPGGVQHLYTGNYTTTIVGMGCNPSTAGVQIPNTYDQGYYLSPLRIFGQGDGIRGYIPGIWAPQQNTPFQTGVVFSAPSGQFAGKSFIAFPIPIYGNGTNSWASTPYTNNAANGSFGTGQVVIEVSSTWS